MPFCCSCGCPSQSDCSAVGGDVLGAKFNGGNTILRVGGTGVAGQSFPRFPRFCITTGTIIPSIHMWSHCARLILYPDAVHDGTTYTLHGECATVLSTAWRPVGNVGRGLHRTSPRIRYAGPCDAYNPNAQRFGYAYDSAWNAYLYSGGAAPGPYFHDRLSGLKDDYFPAKIGTSGAILYGGMETQNPSHLGYWYRPNTADLTTFAGITSGLVSAAVKHTLILYVTAWRSPYMFLNWDRVSWPPWWTANGLTPSGAADFLAYRAAYIASFPTPPTYTMTTAGRAFYEFMHSPHGTVYLVGGRTSGGASQLKSEPDFAAFNPGMPGQATGATTDADSRLILRAAHVICGPCDNILVVGQAGFTPDSTPTPTGGTFTTSTNVDILVQANFIGCMFSLPAFGAGWVTAGTPYRSDTTSPGCWNPRYYIPLIFTGTGTTTMTFGTRSYTLTKT